jgi:hypothetical protein
MSKLFLYSIFHGNLNYSSISPKIYDKIIDSCYWPILDLVKEFDYKTGIEFPLNTLLKIEKIDPLYIEELKKLSKNKKIEIVGSGKEQVVFPLVPSDVNHINLEIGKKETEKLLSTKIKTAFVNEQLFSSSLTSLYLKSNFKNIITIWEWASKISTLDKEEKFKPKKIPSKFGDLIVIWNSYISYQKFQRYVNGEIEKNDFFNYIIANKQKNDSCYPFYGSDMEIFGYKNPVLGLDGTGKEISRFKEILEKIKDEKDLEFILPSTVPKKFPPNNEIDMQSARFAILGKKQDKFTVTRWAACGRDNTKNNTLCYKALKKIRIINSIDNNEPKQEQFMSELCDCWASDFRTHAVEEKYIMFNHMISTLNKKLDDELHIKKENIKKEKGELIIFNPNQHDWNNIPFEINLRFSPSKIKQKFDIFSNNIKLISQIENIQKYKDGSLRSVKLILEPNVSSQKVLRLKIITNGEKIEESINQIKNSVKTNNVEIKLSEKRGASISELKFLQIFPDSLLGFIEHGTFEDTKFSPDFYSGHTVSFNRNNEKNTDLSKVKIILQEEEKPIRKILSSEIDLPIGHFTKKFFIYQNHPRVDIELIFDFKDFKPASFRTAIMTFSPLSFDKNSIYYSTHNGGEFSSHKITKEEINQDESTDPRLTSNGCLGSTEGIFDFGDKEKGVTIFTDKSNQYSVPLLKYQDAEDGKFFFRISNTLAEFDDTSMTRWKGRKEIKFSILGRKEKDVEKNEIKCEMMFLGLLCISNNNDIQVVEDI